MCIKQLNASGVLLWAKESNLSIPIKGPAESEICICNKDPVEFVSFILSVLLTNGPVQNLICCDMNPITKEILWQAASNGKDLFPKLPYPG